MQLLIFPLYSCVAFPTQAFQLRVKTVFAADRKLAAQQFITNNFRSCCGHLFPSLEDVVGGGDCKFHGASCNINSFHPMVHCLVSGLPCQAWTRLRYADKDAKPPDEHEGWNTKFKTFFEYLDANDIQGGIDEQVLGFADTDNRSSTESLKGHRSPFDLFVHELKSRNFWVTTFRLNMAAWLEFPPRERLYIVYLKESLGGKSGIKWIDGAMQEPTKVVNVVSCRCWKHLGRFLIVV